MNMQPVTDRIRLSMRVEPGDIRYPHFSGDNQTDCTRPFFENGLGPRLRPDTRGPINRNIPIRGVIIDL